MQDVPLPTSCALDKLAYPGPADIALAVKEIVRGRSREELMREGKGRGLGDLPEKEFYGPF
jgi:hypothetical protein